MRLRDAAEAVAFYRGERAEREQLDKRFAAVIANYAAGVEVGKLGAATVSPAEVLEAYDHFATERDLSSSELRTAADAGKQ